METAKRNLAMRLIDRIIQEKNMLQCRYADMTEECEAFVKRSIEAQAVEDSNRLRQVINLDGGPGSGNFGHKGRPGEVGGSAEGWKDYSFKDYKKTVIGTKAADGVEIKKLSQHAVQRANKRKVSPEDVADTIKSGTARDGHDSKTLYEKGGLRIVVAPENGTVVTVVRLEDRRHGKT